MTRQLERLESQSYRKKRFVLQRTSNLSIITVLLLSSKNVPDKIWKKCFDPLLDGVGSNVLAAAGNDHILDG
jgi:hypothetical protein